MSTRIVFLLVHGPNLEVCRAVRLPPLDLEDILFGFGRHVAMMFFQSLIKLLKDLLHINLLEQIQL